MSPEKQYTAQTGEPVGYSTPSGVYYHTLAYVRWLEAKVERGASDPDCIEDDRPDMPAHIALLVGGVPLVVAVAITLWIAKLAGTL